MSRASDRPLLLAPDVRFSCKSCGSCCRNDWLIGVDGAACSRLDAVNWARVDPTLPAGDKFRHLPLALAGGERSTFARTASGGCVFLSEDGRCAIHRHLGYEAKPQVCREFPYTFVETPDGVAVGLSFACTAVRDNDGAPLSAQPSDAGQVLWGSTRVAQLPDPIPLYSGIDIGWDDYRPIEQALLAVLGRSDRPLTTCLVAGSVLVNLCVSLVQVERAGPGAGQARETLASSLARLASERHERLFDVAAGVRPPRAGSLAHLAPLHAWLRLSRQKLGRVGLVIALYGDYFRFRRVSGRIPDLVTGGGAVELADIARVRFAATPETEAFLRRYWRHALFRKTLTPAHGVFRGYHLLLALASFTRWAARVVARAAGRDATTLADVQEAVRLVEQRFVLHSQFANLFAVSPVLTILADRMFGARSFVPAAVLDPDDQPRAC